ncbi:MAG: metallophosphoesterase [Candidatus Ranarchaeia archaeon]
MKFLALTDFHDYEGVIDSIVARDEHFDMIICAGDYEFYNEDVLVRVIKKLNQVSSRVFMIPGNIDPPSQLEQLETLQVNFHKKRLMVEGITFVGYGGSNPTPFSTPFEIPEKIIQSDLEDLCQPIPSYPWVLVTHAPPYNTLIDKTRNGEHVGSKAVRFIIEKYKPTIAISGHIHEARGIDNLHHTILVNPGPAHDQNAGIIDIKEENATVKLIRV